MEHILVGKNVAYAAKTGGGSVTLATLNELADGALVIYTDKQLEATANTVIDITAPDFSEADYFYVAVGTPSGTIVSPAIARKRNLVTETQKYVANVKATAFLGNNGSTGNLNLPSLAAGQIFGVNVTISNKQNEAHNIRKSAEYYVKTGDAAAQVVPGIVAALNAVLNPYGYSAAVVGSNAGVSVTSASNNNENVIYIAGYGISENATKQNGFPTIGRGKGEDVAELEERISSLLGNTSRLLLQPEFYSRGLFTNKSANYDMCVLSYDLNTNNIHTPPTVRAKVYVAIPTGASNIDIDELKATFEMAAYPLGKAIPEPEEGV